MKFFLFDKEISSNSDITVSIQNKGSYSSSEIISFENEENHIITIEYVINVEGYEDGDEGDYWTPPYSETIITDFDIEIKKIYYMDINDNEIELNIDQNTKNLISIIKSFYNI
jgi:hypothetical protein